MTHAAPHHDSSRTQGLIYALLGAIAFSGKAILAKLMYKLGADPFAVVGMRMAMAFPLFLAMVWWSARRGPASPDAIGRLSRRQWWQIIGLGFAGYYLASTLDFVGLKYISASLERAILYLNPSIVLVLSALWLGKRIQRAQLVAMSISYVGVVIVWLHDWDVASLVAARAQGMGPMAAISLGSVCVFFSAVSYAVYLMGSGQLVQRMGSMRVAGLASCAACFMATAQWLMLYLVSKGQTGNVAQLPWQVWALSLLNATACTVLPVWLVMRGVQLIGASMASQAGMVGPLSTIWMAAWWLGEPVTWRLMVGTGAVLVGVLVLAKINQRGAPAAAPLKPDPRPGPRPDAQPNRANA
jgi:drug/metabolite transporter (DMT)-like permease